MEDIATRIFSTAIISLVGSTALAGLIILVRRIQVALGVKDDQSVTPSKSATVIH